MPADVLRERRLPVLIGGTHAVPLRRDDDVDARDRLAARLAAAGVTFAIARVGGPYAAANERNLPYEAARAAAHGLRATRRCARSRGTGAHPRRRRPARLARAGADRELRRHRRRSARSDDEGRARVHRRARGRCGQPPDAARRQVRAAKAATRAATLTPRFLTAIRERHAPARPHDRGGSTRTDRVPRVVRTPEVRLSLDISRRGVRKAS